MKHLTNIILATATALLLQSCCTFLQVGTMVSNTVERDDMQILEYKNEDVIVKYDFWNGNGAVGLSVYNRSQDEILLDLSRSYCVANGKYVALNERSRYDHENNSIISETAVIPSQTFYDTKSLNFKPQLYLYSDLDEFPHKEKPNDIYKVPGRKKSKKMSEEPFTTKDFNSGNSPLTIRVHLTFIINGKEEVQEQTFYLAELENILRKKFETPASYKYYVQYKEDETSLILE